MAASAAAADRPARTGAVRLSTAQYSSVQRGRQRPACLDDLLVVRREQPEQLDQVFAGLRSILVRGTPDGADQPLERLLDQARRQLEIGGSDLRVHVVGSVKSRRHLKLAQARPQPARIAEEGVAGSDGRVRVRSDGPLPPVVGDSAKLAQALINLLQNALTLSPEGTPVEVEVSLEDGMAQVRVRDQGPGIAQDFLPRLFQPFQSMRKGGTGLGLAIVQKIVAEHGGTVEAVNNDPPPGATFTVRLPVGE